jgi:CheY-like chemotaxis protein
MIDRNQAEMAILNLAVNARDAMTGGGVIAITSGNVSVREGEGERMGLKPGEYVVLCVSDTGGGMSPEVAERAFEPFFTTKDPAKGSGLGLSQVHGFALQSGGSVRIETQAGAGTTVKLYLPRAMECSETRPALRAAAAASSPGQVVLLVDDDIAVRNGIAAGLGALGHRVIQADSGPQALDALRRHPDVNVLVTDYAMPGMRGTELARVAKTRRPHLRVVLISGFADLPEEEELRWNGLRKPFRPEELAARIDERR